MNWVRDVFHALSRTIAWWFIVAPWEQAIRIRGGKKSTLVQPGVRFKIPFWDRVYRESVRERAIGTTPQVATSVDGKAYSLRAVVRCGIANMETLFNSVNNVDEVIGARVATLLAQYVSSHDSSSITPLGAQGFVNEHLDLSDYGLESEGAEIIDFAAVRTYRLITGDGGNGYWDAMNVSRHIDQRD